MATGLIANSSFRQMKFNSSGNLLQALPSQAGSINYKAISSALTSAGFRPKDGEAWVNDLNNGMLSLDHLDLRGQYEGRVVDMNLAERLTAKGWNQTNSFLYRSVCPLYPTSEFNFGYTQMEVYQIPFDEVDPMNVARGTGYTRKMTTFTLKSYKRAQEAEMLLLSDENFGAEHLRMMRETIEDHAALTFMHLIAQALVDFPNYERLKRLSHPTHGFSHSRELLLESKEVFAGQVRDPAYLLRLVAEKCTDLNKIDTMIVPSRFTANMIKWEGQPQPATSYTPMYDVRQREILLVAYSDGSKTFKTVPIGNGRNLNVFELQGFRAHIDDPISAEVQPLRGVLTMGEIIRDRITSLVELCESGKPVTPKGLTLYAPNQNNLRITVDPLPYGKRLRNCFMFLSDAGMTLDGDDDSLNPIWQRMAEEYNKNSADSFAAAFRDPQHASNNNPSNTYLQSDTRLEDATGTRHFDPFLCLNDETGKVEVPIFVGDVEPKTFVPEDMFAAAELIVKDAGIDTSTYVDPIAALEAQNGARLDVVRVAVPSRDNLKARGKAQRTAVAMGIPQAATDALFDTREIGDVIFDQLGSKFILKGAEIKPRTAEEIVGSVLANANVVAAVNTWIGAKPAPGASPVEALDLRTAFQDDLTTHVNAILAAIAAVPNLRESFPALNDFIALLKKYLPTSALLNYLRSNAYSEADKLGILGTIVNDPFAEGTDKYKGPYSKTSPYSAANPAPGRTTAINAALFAAPLGSPLAPAPGETLDAYKARVTPNVLSAAAEDGSIGPHDSTWVQMLQHVPDTGIDHFLTIAHAVLSRPALTQDDAEGLAELANMLEKETRSSFVTGALGMIARALPNLGNKTIGADLKTRAGRNWLTAEKVALARSAPTPSAVLAAAVESHLENAMDVSYLGSIATVGQDTAGRKGDPAITIKGFLDRAKSRYSWQTYNKHMEERNLEPVVTRLVYAALLQSRFNFKTLDALAKVGIPLIQVPGIRIFIYQQADTIVLTATGPDIMRLAVGHGLLTSGINAQQSIYTMHAAMHAGVLMLQPKCMDIIVHGVAHEHLGGRNLEAIRNQTDLNVSNAMDRRSVIFCALPLSENKFSFPISLTREAPYLAPNQRTKLFSSKISITDSIRFFLGEENFDRFLDLNNQNAEYYMQPMQMATHLHDCAVWRPSTLNPETRALIGEDGTGALGPLARNVPEAVEAYGGMGTFPQIVPDMMER